uniref:Thioredoxin n=1 Tax=Pseudictyota dubia TaxID=2749911 RepID=A0A7R9WE45_9STRA|mmetsp:Transcript_44328/g.82332  ORF Transcript_44328/g.82332 Transcript_44328/m.82332 type:complete len:113 (+) Transcript_44328:102-440(+)|eukprot:CAMPEP_0197448210 /NCGR_PEP_ID=MMETSP1175-20131217/16461_1 /TAXON_ID=1003142 /ORGANISM="Triceratium dubium, Strain CCMP147" /LENGTH=112 /DNA_ID=CAMNT_0042979871 /DNA_START=56 /DNA_END=394 /DNA_ORIENTATION=-
MAAADEGNVIHISSKEEFDKQVAAAADKLVVVDFYATWCGPCKRIKPKYIEYSKEHTHVVFLSVDVDEATDVSDAFSISAMPTFLFLRGGKKVDEFLGGNAEKLLEKIIANA